MRKIVFHICGFVIYKLFGLSFLLIFALVPLHLGVYVSSLPSVDSTSAAILCCRKILGSAIFSAFNTALRKEVSAQHL